MSRRLRVLVQAGHAPPREPGFPATGTAGEIDFALKVRTALVALLEADGRFEAIAVPGDIPGGVRVDVALFLHADGSRNPSTAFYSFGYDPGFVVNRHLADLIAQRFEQIPHPGFRGRDNYTADLRGYYGFRRVATNGPEVVVEHGFMSNPEQRAWLMAHVKELARAEYLAILDHFTLRAPAPQASSRTRVPPWTARVGERVVAVGRLVSPAFIRKIAHELRAGRTVTIGGK